MEREKVLRKGNKLISALIVVMLILSSYGTFLSEIYASAVDYNNQKTEAGDKKVEFDAYFKSENKKIRNVIADTNGENEIYLSLELEEGIVQNGKITFNNPNFAIDYEALKANNLIKSVNEGENSIELNSIAENVEIPVKISYKAGDTINLTDLERDTEINFAGTYADSNKAGKELSSKITVKLQWTSKVQGNLQSTIENYIEAEGKSIVVSKVSGNINGTTIPMEEIEVSTNVPDINGIAPETVEILENGRKLAENEFEYDAQNKSLVIKKENTPNENGEIANLSGNIEYNIIYVYGTQFNIGKVNIVANQNLKVKPYNGEETNISFQNNLEKEQNNQTTILNINSADNITKGYLYWQKYEMQFDVNMDIQVQYILPGKDIEIVEQGNMFTGDSVNLNITNSTYYTNSTISKEELTNILGENGTLEIYDAEAGTLLGTLNKDATVDENGNINIAYNNISRLRFVIKNPEKIGSIHINNTKKVKSNHGIDNETLKAVKQLRLIFTNNNMIYTSTVEKDIKLYDTVTKSTVELDKTEFNTADDSTAINMKINLNTQNMDYDLYKNPVLQVVFPSEFEQVNIETVGITFENGLKLTNAEMTNLEDGRKVLTITIEGEQLEYLNNDITANTQIAITGNVKVYQNLTSRDTNITYTYTNEKAITYDNGGVVNIPVKITAPYGFIMTTLANDTLISKNKELEEVKVRANTASQTIHVKETITNNFDDSVNNFELTGMLPRRDQQYTLGENTITSSFDAEIAGNVTINRNDAKIYYSEDNQNWSETKTMNSNLFKIAFEESFAKGDMVTVEYDLKIPGNISYSKSSYLAFIANAKQNENSVNNWSGMKVSTEDMQMVNQEPQVSTVDEDQLKTEIAVMKGNVSLKDGESVGNEQNLKYIIKVTNTTDQAINNVKVTATNENAVFYEFMIKTMDDGQEDHAYSENPEREQMDFSADMIAPGETKEFSYQVVVKKNGDNSSTSANIKISADSIEEKEIKTITNPIVDSKVKLILAPDTTAGYPDELVEEGMVAFKIEIKNLTAETMNNLTVNLFYTQYIENTTDDIIFSNVESDRTSILENKDNTLKININTLQPNEEIYMFVYGKFKKLEGEDVTKSFYTFCNMVYEDTEYVSGIVDFTVKKMLTDFSLVQTANIEGELHQGDNLIYTTEITNTGNLEGIPTIYGTVPDSAVINNIYIEQNGERKEVQYTEQTYNTSCTMQPGEKVILIIDTTINTYLNNDKEIENTVLLNAYEVEGIKQSNTIRHKVVDEIGEAEDPDNPEEPEDPDNPGDPDNPEDPSTGKRVIGGFVWNDTNKNGIKDTSESNIPGMEVLLTTSTGVIVNNTTTTNNGYYEFTSLEPGSYRVVFEYDTSKYYISPYKVNGADEDTNSDVISTIIEQNGERRIVAATEELNLNDVDLDNVNAGFIEVAERSLTITKSITKVAVSTSKRTTSYDYDRKQIAKLEIHSKEIKNAQIAIEYTIDIQNTGEAEETIQEIIDTPSEGLKLNDASGDWYQKGDQIATAELENTKLAPGETKSLKLIMTTSTGAEGEGKKVTNKADIEKVKSSNENIKVNINNQNNTAQLIIGVSTGALQITIAVIIVLAILAIIAIVIIRKKGGLRKNEK